MLPSLNIPSNVSVLDTRSRESVSSSASASNGKAEPSEARASSLKCTRPESLRAKSTAWPSWSTSLSSPTVSRAARRAARGRAGDGGVV